MELRTLLQQVRRDGFGIQEYFNKLKTNTNHLASIGEKILDKEIMMHLFCGLGLEYRGFVISMNMKVKEPSLFELHILLLTKEKMILE